MTDSRRLMFVSIIGPPGVGKSTTGAALRADLGLLPVFRLREMIRTHPDVLEGLPARDPLGWVDLEAVRRMLHAAFIERLFTFDAAGPVLLDNFPGTGEQLQSLVDVAACLDARVAVIELHAEVSLLVARVASRRVCGGCPDTHAPASPTKTDPERCATCGAKLQRRGTDQPQTHRARLERYMTNRPGITAVAAQHDIPHVTVRADNTLPEVCRAVRHAFDQVTRRENCDHNPVTNTDVAS